MDLIPSRPRKRAHIACKACRKRKIKCNAPEGIPRGACDRCKQKNWPCEYVSVAHGNSPSADVSVQMFHDNTNSAQPVSYAASSHDGVIGQTLGVESSYTFDPTTPPLQPQCRPPTHFITPEEYYYRQYGDGFQRAIYPEASLDPRFLPNWIPATTYEDLSNNDYRPIIHHARNAPYVGHG